MLIERPPEWLRRLAPEATFRIPAEKESEKKVYLTFDDGPVPEVTPRLLDLLEELDVKATFFMVGDNVRKYPELYRRVLECGHKVGNHTMHHLQGLKEETERYLQDIEDAAAYIESDMFRPPHGWMKRSQRRGLAGRYRIVMYDVVTRDYSKRLNTDDVVRNVMRYSRDGSIIVFHDSKKSEPRLFDALSRSVNWLKSEGYRFEVL